MPSPEKQLVALGLVPAGPWPLPPGVSVPLSFITVIGKRVLLSGHGPQLEDGGLAIDYLGKLGQELDVIRGAEAARLTALAMLGTLKRELGSLDRIDRWVRVFGMVNAVPEFTDHTPVINGFSETIIDVFGESGRCVRCAVGMSSLPMNIPVEVEAEVLLR